jgi:sugar O-acyltransferase (sialic acid O-acetyltransferase NeuD family)
MKLLLLGAGGFAREARVWCYQSARFVMGFYEDNAIAREVSKIPVLGTFPRGDVEYLAAVGDPVVRMMLVDKAQKAGLLATDAVVHPTVIYGSTVAIGCGSILCPRVITTVDIRIGKHCIVNIGATIGHDVMIGDYVTISPGAHISGNVTIGRGAYIGSGAVLREGVTIGDNAIIGAGAVVVDDVPDHQTWAGVPARRLK